MCYYLQLVSLLYILVAPTVCSYSIHSSCPWDAHTLTRWTSEQLADSAVGCMVFKKDVVKRVREGERLEGALNCVWR